MSSNLGQHNSKKRILLIDILKSAAGPLTIYEILAEANKETQTISISTFYRTIKKFLKSEELKVVNLPDGQTRYTVPSSHHHHHFLCRVCYIALDVDHCCVHLQSDEMDGHLVKNHEIAMTGVCKDCR